MATTIVSHPGAGLACRQAIQDAVDAASSGDTLRFTSTTSATWLLDGRSGDANQDNVKALGTVEIANKNVHLLFDPGVTITESPSALFPGDFQPAFRWLNATGDVTFRAGSRLTGRRSSHAGSEEGCAGLRYVHSSGTIRGNGEAHITEWKGDGIWLSAGGGTDSTNYPGVGSNGPINIYDMLLSSNYRHGLTVEDVDGLSVYRCGGSLNNGYGSSRWCDMEPDTTQDKLANIVFDGCRFAGHANALSVDLLQLGADSTAVSIIVRNCDSYFSGDSSDEPYGFNFRASASACSTNGGTIEIINCRANGLRYAGFYFDWNLASKVQLRLNQCTSEDCSSLNSDKPFTFALAGAATGYGIRLNDCTNIDRNFDRVSAQVASSGGAATNVRGNIRTRRFAQQDERTLAALLPNVQFQSGGGGFVKRKTRTIENNRSM
ncbi:hypothetical protein [Nitrospira sp. BLG_1]|uniref:hypothetical protein n=1 Tax=Nitrospira sp. BLG_1 TaxID=3395883 RepID=UPI0039BD2772